MSTDGYQAPHLRSITPETVWSGMSWQKRKAEFRSVAPTRPKKPIRRSASFNNDVDVPPMSKRDRALIPAVPRFEETPRSQEVSEGSVTCFACKVRGNPNPTIKWLKGSTELKIPSERMNFEADDDEYRLIIKPTKASDRGRYTCIASNKLGKASCYVLLNVHIHPKFKTGSNHSFGFSSVKMPLTRKGSSDSTFAQRSRSSTEGGYRGGYFDDLEDSISGDSDNSSSVFSDKISTSSHALKSSFIPSRIESSDRRMPEFIKTLRYTVAEDSKSVVFTCQLDGSPPPKVTWYKGSAKLLPSDRVVITEKDNGWCSLEIRDERALDVGKYKCLAMNRIGKSSNTVELRLTAKASSHTGNESPPTFSQPLTEVEISEGGRARFECKVEGRPKPTIVWKKDGEVILASNRVRIMEVYGTHSLVISRTDHADTGTYSICATNNAGKESLSAQLRVKEPSHSSRPSTPRGRRSETATSTYSSSGSPSTSNMSSPSMSPKLGRAANSRLVSGSISSWTTDAKPRSGGGAGSSPRRRAPGFILRPRPQTVAPGDNLMLKCTLLGFPKPTISWEKDGNKLEDLHDDRIAIREDGNDYFLEVKDCTPEDAGKYSVQAKNSLGRQVTTVDIIVSGASGRVPSKTVMSTDRQKNSSRSHEIGDKLNVTTPSRQKTTKSQAIEVTINSKNVNSNNNRLVDGDRKHGRESDYILPPSNKEENKSPKTSFTSTYSRISTTSRSASKADELSPGRSIKSHHVAPTFTRRLSSTQVLEGEDLELHCDVTGNPMPEVVWTRNGMPISMREANTSVEMRNGSASLKVARIKPTQAGEYLCLAKNDIGDCKCSSRVTVKLKQKTSAPRFVRPPKDARVAEGDTVTLEAEVSGQPEPEILWSLDGEEISNEESIFQNNIATLTLRNVTVACSGQYMCTAINDSGEDSVACRVRIKQKKADIPPEFTAPLSDVMAKENEDVSLRCMVTGIPEPRVQWLFNDEVLDSGDGIEITYQDGVAALTIDQVTVDDTGCYSCVAVNNEGQSSTSCQVIVSDAAPRDDTDVEKAPDFVTKFDDYVRCMEGDSVTLECEIKGNPQPDVTWTLERRPIKNAQQCFQNGKAVLTIASITTDHGGSVACTAKNCAGQVKHEGRLYVRAKREGPSFLTQLPEKVEVTEGKEVTFGCHIKGHPQPRVSWTRNGRSLSVLNTETSYEEGKASVRIRKAGSSDGGRYVCTARNLSGEAESSCQVTVVEEEATHKPEFIKALEDLTLEENQDIRLSCKVIGTPPIDITWILDGQKLEAEDGDASFKDGVASMILEDAMTEDSGRYECIAKNAGGEAKSSCRVDVKVKKPVEEEPSFPIQLEDMTIKENEDILLKCQVIGNPRPTITWLLDGDPFPEGDCKYSEDGHAELFLPKALPEDEGVYTCIAQNKLKRVMCSCKVTVTALPKVSRRNKQGPEASKVQIKAEAKRNVSKAKREETVSSTSRGATKPAPTSSAKRVNGTPNAKSYHESSEEEKETEPTGPERPPQFLQELEDRVVPDGSINYRISAFVTGLPAPVVKWYYNGEEIEESDDFKYETDGEARSLIFTEIFPEDSGEYSCVARNAAGEVESKMQITVEEIDGDPPNFILKPRPLTVNAGENAFLTCKVDGEPVPTVKWMFCNQPIVETERTKICAPSPDNNYTHSLEITETRIEDAGRYAACSSNLLGDVTCTVSLIVNAPKSQEERKDFRDVLKRSTSGKSKTLESAPPEQLDFRGVLKKAEGPTSPDPTSGKTEEIPAFREALSRPVKTKVLSEEERKMLKGEQKDFRGTLTRKVAETRTSTSEAIKLKSGEQKDFRDEALKTRVKTKAYTEDAIKQKQAEQIDFRGEALKTKVVTKAYKEEAIKMKKAEQMDFREVLSPTRRAGEREEVTSPDTKKGYELPSAPAKMKINRDSMDHNTVATRRARTRGSEPTSRRARAQEQDERRGKAPEFIRKLSDISVKDSDPFELICHVAGNPLPKVSWFLEDNEEIHAESDITISYEDGVCKLHVAESFPEDDGTYTCRAENEHGVVKCSAHVTVVTDESNAPAKPLKYLKKQSSMSETPAQPARIKNGPNDTAIVQGNAIHLSCTLTGTPPLKSVWRKGKNEIRHSDQCNIECTDTAAKLTILHSERDDSGCYILQVKNLAGVDQFSINVSVVDVPDAPGKPHASDINGDSLVLSWYGTGYDGGSTVTAYRVEKAEVNASGRLSDWSVAAHPSSTSCTVKKLKANSRYVFRVCAENKYGQSVPGDQSDIIINSTTEVADSSEDEESFFTHPAVEIRTDGTFSKKYETKEKLGQGRFGKVHRVIDRDSGKAYAAKIMRALKAKDKEAVQQEIDVMNSLRHPRLVQLIDAFSHGREITMVMDLVSGGELFERVIDEDFELTEAACIKYMRQICDGLKYMHDALILHLDLKPENIMCINKTGTQIKIIDFGLARRFNPREVIRVMFGTPEFVAPEVINYDAIGPQTDMWSVGVICYILLSGLSPFMGDNDSETLSNITAAEWDFDDESFDEISYEAKDFIRQLLVKPLSKRYDVHKALDHKWLKKDTNKMNKSKLNTKNLKRFLARRKWQKTGNAVRALGRLASLANLGSSSKNPNKIANGQPRESGFLAALKAQLLRENEEEQENHANCKPMFEQLFDDIEVIEGSAVKFECTIIGTPDPEIMWFKDGEPITESRHYRISYTEDDVCTLLITDATEADEAEYTCRAVNCEGETEHRAELIVITPGV